MKLTVGIRTALKNAAAALKGHARRLFMAQVVRVLGRGGQRQAQPQLDWSRDTVRKGEHELTTGIECVCKKLRAAAMRALEKRLQRMPGLEKWFVDVVPRPEPG